MAKGECFERFYGGDCVEKPLHERRFNWDIFADPRGSYFPMLPFLGWWISLEDALRAYGKDASIGGQQLRRRVADAVLASMKESPHGWRSARATVAKVRRQFRAEWNALEPGHPRWMVYHLVILELSRVLKIAIDFHENPKTFFAKQELADAVFIGRRHIGDTEDEHTQWVLDVLSCWGAAAVLGSQRVRNVFESLSCVNYNKVLFALTRATTYRDGRPRIPNKDERDIAVANDYAKFLDEEKSRPLSRRGEGLLKVAERVFNRLSDKYDKRSESTLRKWLASGRKLMLIQGGKDVQGRSARCSLRVQQP